MPTEYVEPGDLPVVRPPRAAMIPRQGTTVLFHHAPDGTVTATSRGLAGKGRTVAEALADLERRIKAADPAA